MNLQPVHDLCAEYDVTIVPKHRYPDVGETRAVTTLARIMRRHGEGHLRLVLSTLAETANKRLLDEVLLWAASDLIIVWSDVVETQTGDWLDTWDAMPVNELQFMCQEDLSGKIPQRFALGGMLHERLHRRFGPNAAQLDLLDDRREQS